MVDVYSELSIYCPSLLSFALMVQEQNLVGLVSKERSSFSLHAGHALEKGVANTSCGKEWHTTVVSRFFQPTVVVPSFKCGQFQQK